MRLWIMLGLLGGCAEEAIELRVTSYNVLCSICSDGHFDDDVYDDWATRLPHLKAQLASHDADLIGLQELLYTTPNPARSITDEVADLGGRSAAYTSVYYERDPADPQSAMDYPDATILFKTERFDLLRQGKFWLSPTPDTPFSAGFDPGGQLPRLVVWAELQIKNTEQRLIFATTHVDNNSPSQERSAPLIRERLQAIAADLPVILVGDFNSDLDHPAYVDLTSNDTYPFYDTWRLAATPEASGEPAATSTYPWNRRIDHIFVRPKERFATDFWRIDLTRYANGTRTASDHRPVHATVRLLP